MILCVNHMTLASVKSKYPKITVRLISPEGLRVKNPNLTLTILTYRVTIGTGKISLLLYGSLVINKEAIVRSLCIRLI